MKMAHKKALSQMIAAAALAGASTCALAADTIKIALAGPVTGPVAQYGDMQFIGAKMAIEHLPSNGFIMCRDPRTHHTVFQTDHFHESNRRPLVRALQHDGAVWRIDMLDIARPVAATPTDDADDTSANDTSDDAEADADARLNMYISAYLQIRIASSS